MNAILSPGADIDPGRLSAPQARRRDLPDLDRLVGVTQHPYLDKMLFKPLYAAGPADVAKAVSPWSGEAENAPYAFLRDVVSPSYG